MGQRIRIDISLSYDLLVHNWGCSTLDRSQGDKIKKDRRLKYVQADDLLDEVILGDDPIKTDHHEDDEDPVVVLCEDFCDEPFHDLDPSPSSSFPFLSFCARSKKMETVMAMTVIPMPISTKSMPRALFSSKWEVKGMNP